MSRKTWIVLFICGVLLPLIGAGMSIWFLATHNVSEARAMYQSILLGVNLALAFINTGYLWSYK